MTSTRRPPAHRGKIFGVGLNKTGTRSLAVALRRLGYRTLHKGDAGTSRLVEAADNNGRPLLADIGEKFDAYLDVAALTSRYSSLDEQYPGSKFILTTSDEQAWLDSRTKHVMANQERARQGQYHGGWTDIDEAAWRRERIEHNQAVVHHFRERPQDLLVFDIRGGHGWEELASFLGQRPPRSQFPWENRVGSGTYAAEGRRHRLSRRTDLLRGKIHRIVSRPR